MTTTPMQQQEKKQEEPLFLAPTTDTTNDSKRKRQWIDAAVILVTAESESPSMNSELALPQGNPKRRFTRRNSKCPSMFYEMLTPANLLELQRDADETRTPALSMKPALMSSSMKNYEVFYDLKTVEPFHKPYPTRTSASYRKATLSILTEASRLSSSSRMRELHNQLLALEAHRQIPLSREGQEHEATPEE